MTLATRVVGRHPAAHHKQHVSPLLQQHDGARSVRRACRAYIQSWAVGTQNQSEVPRYCHSGPQGTQQNGFGGAVSSNSHRAALTMLAILEQISVERVPQKQVSVFNIVFEVNVLRDPQGPGSLFFVVVLLGLRVTTSLRSRS